MLWIVNFPMVNWVNASRNAEAFYNVFYISDTSLLIKLLTLSMPFIFRLYVYLQPLFL